MSDTTKNEANLVEITAETERQKRLAELFPVRDDGTISLSGLLAIMKAEGGIPRELCDDLGLGK